MLDAVAGEPEYGDWSRPTIREAETPLDDWYRIAKRSWWTSLVDVRRTCPHADSVGEFTIFNIGGK